MGAAFAHGVKEVVEGGDQLLFYLDITDATFLIAGFQILNFFLVGVEIIMVDKDRIAFNAARNIGADAVGVSVHAGHLSAHGGGIVTEHDCVAQALAHLRLPIRADQRAADDIAFGNREDFTIGVVKAAGDLAGDLDMALIVLADRHQMGARQQNIRRLQNRIAQQSIGNLLQPGRVRHILDRRQLLQALDCD